MLGHLLRRALPSTLAMFGIAAVAISSAGAAQPAAWPPKLVRIVVPFGAGSTPDIVGRVLADRLRARHPATSFVIENKPGASGNIGTDTVAKAAPDGATLGISIPGPLVINQMVFAKLPYDPERDITPVTMLTRMPSVLVVPTSLGTASVAEFVAKVKADTRGLAYASIGAGSLSQLCMEAIAQKAGGSMVHIPYAGSPNAVTALIRGDVQAGCLPAISVAPQLAAGKLKILAVTTPQRSPFLPDVPTLKESGIEVESDAWNALIAPRGTSPELVAEINREFTDALADPAVITKLKTQMILAEPSTPEALRQKIADEKRTWAEVIKAAGIEIR